MPSVTCPHCGAVFDPDTPRHVIARFAQTGDCSPSQWEGFTTRDQFVYIRYRGGVLSIHVGGAEVMRRELGDSLDGALNFFDLLRASRSVLDWAHAEPVPYDAWRAEMSADDVVQRLLDEGAQP